MKHLIAAGFVCAVLGIVVLAAQPPAPASQAQQPPAQPAPNADPYANNARPGATESRSPRRRARTATRKRRRRRARSTRGRSTRRRGNTARRSIPSDAKVWNPAKLKLMQGGKVTGGTVLQRHRSGDLLRDGQRRLRLHLDRDAARPARLAGRGAHVAHLPDRQGGARRPRRLHRRARNPACARRRRARGRGPHGGHGRGSDRSAQLDLLPAARPAAATAAARRSTRRCGAACRAAIAPPSTTTSC